MKLFDRIGQDITAAMRAKDQTRLAPLRMAKAALMNREVDKGRALEEAEAEQVIASLIKQRRDSIEQFRKGGRDDLADKEAAEIGTLEAYLPPPIDATGFGLGIASENFWAPGACALDCPSSMKTRTDRSRPGRL